MNDKIDLKLCTYLLKIMIRNSSSFPRYEYCIVNTVLTINLTSGKLSLRFIDLIMKKKA